MCYAKIGPCAQNKGAILYTIFKTIWGAYGSLTENENRVVSLGSSNQSSLYLAQLNVIKHNDT